MSRPSSTNSRRAGRTGRQEPRFLHSPRRAKFNHAEDCAFLSSGYGLAPDPWQKTVLEAWLGERADGKWAAGRWGVAVPRQNGKNGILEMVELYLMVALGMRVLHTAHEVKTARKAFLRLRGFFTNDLRWPELAALVRETRMTNGQEAIILHGPECKAPKRGEVFCSCKPGEGGSIEFVARSRGSARGYTVDVLVCDEAQELTDEQLEALLPTISSAPSGNPAQIYTGTPPPPTSPGTVFPRMRAAGVTGKDKRLAWVEWSVPEVGNVRDRDRWADTNPALGLRLQESVIEDEVEQLTQAGFARERLGWWADVNTAKVSRLISADSWEATTVEQPPPEGDRCLAVAFSFDGARQAVATAVRHSGDAIYAELTDEQTGDASSGIGKIVDWLMADSDGAPRWKRVARICVAGGGEAATLLSRLEDAGVYPSMLHKMSTADVLAANARTLDAIRERRFTHPVRPGDALSESVAVSDQRQRAGGWSWQATSLRGDSLPIEVVCMATWGAETAEDKAPIESVRKIGRTAGRRRVGRR